MSSIKINQFDGDASVGRNLSVGGKAEVAGSAHIGHNLKVDGWLEAKNIKGVNKGIFTDPEKLRTAYPNPADGWVAGVGVSTPFETWIGDGGVWKRATKVVNGEEELGTMEIVIDNQQVENLNEDVEGLRGDVSTLGTTVGQHTQQIENLRDVTVPGVQQQVNDVSDMAEANADEITTLKGRMTTAEGGISTISANIGQWHTEDIQRFERDEVAMAGLDARFNTMLQTNDTDALDSFQEIVAFLNGISKNESLSRIVSSLRQRIDSAYNRLYSLASPLTTVKIDNDGTSIAITINHSALNLISMAGKQKSIPLGETRTWTILNGQSLWADPENDNIVVRTRYVIESATPLILLADNEGGFVRNGLFANVPQPTYTGKSWCAIGDSITEANDSSWYPYRGYQSFVKEKLGFSACYNRGIGGQTAKSYAQLIEANHPQANIPVADIYTIAFGINDWSNSNSGRTPAGGINDYLADNPDVETTAGALRKIIDHVYSKNPQAKVILMTPCKAEGRGDNPGGLPHTWATANTNGDYLADYADVIKGIGVAMSIPVVDLFGNALLNAKTLGNWTLDFLHPNEAGHQLIANALVDKLNNVL